MFFIITLTFLFSLSFQTSFFLFKYNSPIFVLHILLTLAATMESPMLPLTLSKATTMTSGSLGAPRWSPPGPPGVACCMPRRFCGKKRENLSLTMINNFIHFLFISHMLWELEKKEKAQGSDSGPFGTVCVNRVFSNDPF